MDVDRTVMENNVAKNNMTKNTTFFSIIVPVYNVAPYLRECLDSVLAQTYPDWECLCVNDGSTDESGAILDEYAKKDARFRIFHKKNGGVSSARNLALDNVRGEWVLFVDSDDYLSHECLKHFYTKCEIERYTFVSCRVNTFQNGILKKCLRSSSDFLVERRDFLQYIDVIYSATVWGISFSRRYLNDNKIRFKCDLKVHEDAFFVLEVLLHAEHVCHITSEGYCYRLPDYRSIEGRESLVSKTRYAYYYYRILAVRLLLDMTLNWDSIGRALFAYFVKRCMYAFWNDYDHALYHTYKTIKKHHFFEKKILSIIECNSEHEKLILLMCKLASSRYCPYWFWFILRKGILQFVRVAHCLTCIIKKARLIK